ncbi:MAG: DUF4178 domain-containing protein [Clostridium chrysemydis]|uniref:DUF4178 domain-containing protein n=1 Tax=Clostridium TaxID=1485 RepID=UPI0021535DDC|nr:DUF4178 domain-containing protein [Clostridium sp. LY3-2]MCR6516198.1 DUF4178 domain-containing protein [Clostridium sp. LY3-2]
MGIFDRLKQVIRSNNAIEKEEHMNKKNLFNLNICDIISVEEIDYEVEAILEFNDHGFRWREYKLKDALKTLWLSVEQDDELEISLYEEIRIPCFEINRKITYDGVEYFKDEDGEAIVEKVEGAIGVVRNERVMYYEYCDRADEKYLSVEVWQGETEVSLGREVKEYNIEIYG